ncbi:signal peptidase I [Micromonospora sp. NPDC049891]|uniref:signal peptidase I n=1 Tax=Micromonospora sp. NPDC049891 TaxID=3155655 RepID=UPI0033E77A59
MTAAVAGFADLIAHTVSAGRPARIPVTGSSMWPAITPGSVVTVEPAAWSRIRPGDVIAYRHQDAVIVHRVIEIRGDHLITAGDNKPLFDPPVTATALLGRVTGVPDPVPPPAPAPAPAAEATVWVVGDRAPAAPPGVRLRQVAPTELAAALRSATGTIAGLSAAAVRPLTALRTASPGPLTVVIGIRFGHAGASRTGYDPSGLPLLPPEAVHLHVRAGNPLSEVAPDDAVRAVAETLGQSEEVVR